MGIYGKSFCFTGGLNGMTRRSVNSFVRERGGKVSNHVCRTTDYLVAAGGSLTGGSTKLTDAKRMGVKVITESEFMAMA